MATAERTDAIVMTTTTEPRVVLTLDEDEAEFLEAILRRISGDPANSPRKYQESISKALRSVPAVTFGRHPSSLITAGSGIRFNEYPGQESEDW